jgi:hypothetical protein
VSIVCLSRVLEQSESTLGARLVLIALAEFAHDDGSRAYPAVETLCRRTRMSRRAVQQALRRLEELGEIAHVGTSPLGTHVYRVLVGAEVARADSARGADDDTGGAQNPSSRGAADAPNPSRPSSSTRQERKTGEHPEFGEWVGYHHRVTGLAAPKAGTRAREHVATSYAARREEGYSQADLKAAVRGAFADDFRREKGYVTCESVLRPTKVADLAAKGARVAEPGEGKYDRFEGA